MVKKPEVKQLEHTLQFVRFETLVRKYPLHLLQSKGSDIRELVFHCEEQESEKVNLLLLPAKQEDKEYPGLTWKVLFTSPEGTPGTLAYRVDRLVIDKRLDEQSPANDIPGLLCLGTLNDICEELGITKSGPNKKNVTKALLQLQGTLIDIKGGSGHVRFSRYESVIFTGNKLPDGTRANAVFICLSQTYRALLAKVSKRPLDYNYLRELPPASARLYEIISSRVFAALTRGGRRKESADALCDEETPVAKILYSKFCELSAMTRYSLYWEMCKQMERLSEPHIMHGYIKEVRYEGRRGGDGQSDWMMCFIPGERAYRELQRSQAPSRGKVQEQKHGKAPADLEEGLLERLCSWGISTSRAESLIESHTQGALEWLTFLESGNLRHIKNKAGYLVRMIEDGVSPIRPKDGVAARDLGKVKDRATPSEPVESTNEREQLKALSIYLKGLSETERDAFEQGVLDGISVSERNIIDSLKEGELRDRSLDRHRLKYWQSLI